jgi:RHS repeat-associated protein
VVIEKAYTYDLRGRLTSVTTDGSVTESYSYDLNGNRTNSLNGVAVYDAQDRLLSSGSAVFAYDLNGSQTNKTTGGQSTAYSYDLFGQLSAVTLPDGRVVSYDRDPLNRVIAKRINGVVTQGWIYKDGLKPIAETDAASNIVSLFVYGTSALTPDTMIRDGVTYRLIRDVQGSVRLVVNVDSGAIAQRLDYDSFGNVSQDTNPGFQPFGFQSGLYDTDTALVHFGARWYDSATGRWLSKDPILLAGGLNLYAFCGNDPVNFADPLGLAESLNQNFRNGDQVLQNIRTFFDAGQQVADSSMWIPDWYVELATMLALHSGPWSPLDFKSQNDGRDFMVNGSIIGFDEFGNYCAGYSAGYGDTLGLYTGIRIGGVIYSSMIRGVEHWTDRDSIPAINQGFEAGREMRRKK